MALTPSTMLPLGTKAPAFKLMNVDGKNGLARRFQVGPRPARDFHVQPLPLREARGRGIGPASARLPSKGAAVVGINSNNPVTHPGDSPEQMVHEAESRGYTFPYLFDETQKVAKAYRAACTPDFYVFDKDHKLVYRGQWTTAGLTAAYR